MIEDISSRAGESVPTPRRWLTRRSMLEMLRHLPQQLFVFVIVSFQRSWSYFSLNYFFVIVLRQLIYFCDLNVFCTSEGLILCWCILWHPESNFPDGWAAPPSKYQRCGPRLKAWNSLKHFTKSKQASKKKMELARNFEQTLREKF